MGNAFVMFFFGVPNLLRRPGGDLRRAPKPSLCGFPFFPKAAYQRGDSPNQLNFGVRRFCLGVVFWRWGPKSPAEARGRHGGDPRRDPRRDPGETRGRPGGDPRRAPKPPTDYHPKKQICQIDGLSMRVREKGGMPAGECKDNKKTSICIS